MTNGKRNIYISKNHIFHSVCFKRLWKWLKISFSYLLKKKSKMCDLFSYYTFKTLLTIRFRRKERETDVEDNLNVIKIFSLKWIR